VRVGGVLSVKGAQMSQAILRGGLDHEERAKAVGKRR